jgi:hypothetical protein
LLSDCRLMLSYARKNGFAVRTELIEEIAWLDAVLAAKNISPISAVSSALVGVLTPEQIAKGFKPRTQTQASADEGQAGAGLLPEEMILKVHDELSILIAPTTALTLQTSEPPPGKAHILGGMPPLVENTIWVALASALVFIVSAAVIGHEAGVEKVAAAASAAQGTASAPSAQATRSATVQKVERPAPREPEASGAAK